MISIDRLRPTAAHSFWLVSPETFLLSYRILCLSQQSKIKISKQKNALAATNPQKGVFGKNNKLVINSLQQKVENIGKCWKVFSKSQQYGNQNIKNSVSVAWWLVVQLIRGSFGRFSVYNPRLFCPFCGG